MIQFARERSREAHSLSEGRNTDTEKLLALADKHLKDFDKKQQTGLASASEKDKIESNLDKFISKLEAAEKADRSDEDKKLLADKRKEIQAVQDKISSNTNFTTQNLRSSLNKKQKKIVSDIIALLYDVLDDSNFEKARDAILNKFQIPQK